MVEASRRERTVFIRIVYLEASPASHEAETPNPAVETELS
jgi:hypothetical protein